MGGCAIGRAYMRMRMRMCMRERRERGRMDGGRGDFTCCKGYPQQPPPAAPGGCSPSLPGIFYLLQGISLFRCLLSRMRMRPPDYAPTFSPPPYMGGENGHIGACARACVRMRMRMRMRMREGGCLSCCGLYTPPQPPAPPRCPLDVEKCKIFDLRGLFLCGGKIYQPLPKNAGEGKRMGK